MFTFELPFTAVLQCFDDGTFLEEALLFPEVRCLGHKLPALERTLKNMLIRTVTGIPPFELHRRRLPGAAEAGSVELTLAPAVRSLAWQEPVKVRFPVVLGKKWSDTSRASPFCRKSALTCPGHGTTVQSSLRLTQSQMMSTGSCPGGGFNRGGFYGGRGYGGWGYGGLGWGLGYYGYPGWYAGSGYSPYAYADPYYYSQPVPYYQQAPVAVTPDTSYQSNYPPSYTADNSATVEVRVPPNAQLWFDGTQTKQTGPDRFFTTPPLTPGQTFSYEIRATWMVNGSPVTQTRQVQVAAGKQALVNFMDGGVGK